MTLTLNYKTVLAVGGGHGSYENMFNAESVAQQISRSPVPAALGAVKVLVSIDRTWTKQGGQDEAE
jgi:hypothetical protein